MWYTSPCAARLVLQLLLLPYLVSSSWSVQYPPEQGAWRFELNAEVNLTGGSAMTGVTRLDPAGFLGLRNDIERVLGVVSQQS